MARLIKEWMKAKKGICSSDCECLTITGWKCYAEEHLCNCGDGGSTPPVPPVPVITYTIEKEEENNSTSYTVSMKTDGELTESYTLILNYNDQNELDTAAITNGTIEKNIQILEDALGLASVAEEGLLDDSKTETVFEQFKEFYNSL